MGLGLIVCPKGALGAKGVSFWFFMPGPGPPLLFSVFVFPRPPATSEGPGLPLTERSKTLGPAAKAGPYPHAHSTGLHPRRLMEMLHHQDPLFQSKSIIIATEFAMVTHHAPRGFTHASPSAAPAAAPSAGARRPGPLGAGLLLTACPTSC